MTPAQQPDLHPSVILGVAAHPDDLDFFAGGVLAKFAEQGAKLHYLILTDGSRGTTSMEVLPRNLVKTRQAEQQAALDELGGGSIEFLSYTDGCLEVTQELKRDIVEAIRTVQPDLVITLDPGLLYSVKRGVVNHPDHRAAGQATLDAVYPLARDHLSFPELFAVGLRPHKVRTVLLANDEKGNYYPDITSTIDKKMAAWICHESQNDDLEKVQIELRELAADFGLAAGCQYAECFVRIDIAQ